MWVEKKADRQNVQNIYFLKEIAENDFSHGGKVNTDTTHDIKN